MSPRPETHPSAANPAAARPFWRREWFLGLLLVLAALAAYQQVWRAGFIWDDDSHLTENPVVVGPLGLREIWTTRAARICPLVLTTFRGEYALWGLHPLPYHVVNVLLHAASALVLWRLLACLRVPGAWLGAALWALHPVQVETVAWITELKNTQSGLFYLLAAFFFVRWVSPRGPEERGGGTSYALALLFCALAMASKSSTVVLPIVLGLCAWWIEGRLSRRAFLRLLPVALMAVAASALSIWTQHLEGANAPEWARGLGERIAVTGRVFWFYLGKLAWPHPLVFVYPRWTIEGTRPGSYLPTLAMAAVLIFLWWNRRGPLRPVFFAAAYFLAALLPVLGLVDQFFLRYSFVGDHFQYLASMGPLALAGSAAAAAFGAPGSGRPVLRPGLAALVLVVLGVLTWRQSRIYRDDETLWRATLAGNPASWMAYNNLGVILTKTGRLDAAVADFRQGLGVRDAHAEGHFNLGNAYLQMGRNAEAFAEYRRALEIEPDNFEAHYNLGNALLKTGNAAQGAGEFQRALAIKPDYAEGFNGLAAACLREKRLDEAAAAARQAIKLRPDYAEAHFNLGNVMARNGRLDEAAREYTEALRTDPQLALANLNLGNVLMQKGKTDEAIRQYERALALRPDYSEAHHNLGVALQKEGRTEEARVQFEAAPRPR